MQTGLLTIIIFLNNLGGGELLVILLFVLMFFGAKKVPELARGLGKGMREVKDAMNGIQRDIQTGVEDVTSGFEEEKKAIEDIKKEFSEDPSAKPRE
jgi:sec-independent protein translocase protein TatA